MTRKQFLQMIAAAGAGAFGVAVLGGCTSEGGQPGPGPGVDAPGHAPIDAPPSHTTTDAAPDGHPASCPSTVAAISANHGHAITVSGADVAAGVAKTYDIQGTASHPHSVTVSAAMFAMLKSSMSIMIVSMGGSHTHTVTITCA